MKLYVGTNYCMDGRSYMNLFWQKGKQKIEIYKKVYRQVFIKIKILKLKFSDIKGGCLYYILAGEIYLFKYGKS